MYPRPPGQDDPYGRLPSASGKSEAPEPRAAAGEQAEATNPRAISLAPLQYLFHLRLQGTQRLLRRFHAGKGGAELRLHRLR